MSSRKKVLITWACTGLWETPFIGDWRSHLTIMMFTVSTEAAAIRSPAIGTGPKISRMTISVWSI